MNNPLGVSPSKGKPYFLFAAIHHLKSSPTISVRPCSSVGRVTADLTRRSWVRLPPRLKIFCLASCGSLFPFTRGNAHWVIHSKGDFCLRMREKLFHFYLFVNALREARFSVLLNLTTEPLKENHCLIGPQ